MLFPYDYLVVPTAGVLLLYLYYTNQKTRRDFVPLERKEKVLAKKTGLKKPSSNGNGNGGEDDAAAAAGAGGAAKHAMKVFFGSQTGTAEDFAKKFAQEAKQWGFAPKVVDLENFSCDDFPLEADSVSVFMLATYGEGEPTDNARDFWAYLNDEKNAAAAADGAVGDAAAAGILKNMKYIVFGLGNKTYEHYNEVARVADAKLAAFGAKRLCERGEGDDDSSLEEDFLSWKETVFPELCAALGIEAHGSNALTRQYKMVKYLPTELKYDFKPGCEPNQLKSAVESTVLVNRELHGSTSDRSCRHIEIDATRLSYDTGDHLGIYPSNEQSLIDEYLERLDVPPSTVFSLQPVDSSVNKSRYPSPCSIQTALAYYCDLTGHATKKMIRVLAEYAKDSNEKERLMVMAGTSVVSKEEYGKYVKEGMRTVLDVLNDFPSVQLPLDHFLEEMPALQCRFYSISSSPLLSKDRIHVTAVLAEWDAPGAKLHRKGVCTRWICDAKEQSKVKCFVRKSTFRLPRDVTLPVIMVGPGTGLAPFRGFIQDRFARKKRGDAVGNTMLYFGCRKRDVDFIYEEEMLEYARNGTLTELNLAFSRENPNEKVYVQHLIKANGESVYKNFIESKGYFYVCGEGSRMAKDVQRVLIQIISERSNCTEEKAKDILSNLQKQGKFQQDVWS